MKQTLTLIIVSLSILSCDFKRKSSSDRALFKLGFKTDSTSTGPLFNSAFVLKVNDSLPALLLTAHHAVAGSGNNQFVKWNEVEKYMKNGWAWGMSDTTLNFKLGRNVAIRNAETLKLDLAAFYTQPDVPYLRPFEKTAQVGDTVYLYSLITHENNSTLKNRGVVIYVADSVLVYELTDFNMARIMTGTSGSCVINKNQEVVSNSYAGFTIPNEQVRQEIALRFPLLNRFKTTEGKTYGVGLPVLLIEKSLIQAFKENPN